MNETEALREKLRLLRIQLHRLETEGAEKIRQSRIDSDMGDDYRENEQAKMVMMNHDIWYIRKVALKREILAVKQKLLAKVVQSD